MPLVFEWDERKARGNLRKHRISFAEAALVFTDPLARIFADEHHSEDDHREILVGNSPKNRLLVVSFTELLEGTVRIISARLATKREQRDYEEHTAS
jgi:uncharacterized DUF497 family protein